MAIVGLTVETRDFKFDILKKDNGRFEISTAGLEIEFPFDAVEFARCTQFTSEDDPHHPYGVVMSVKWGHGHKVHFRAYMPLRSAQDLNKHFPEFNLSL